MEGGAYAGDRGECEKYVQHKSDPRAEAIKTKFTPAATSQISAERQFFDNFRRFSERTAAFVASV
jgi:hypothetical protein